MAQAVCVPIAIRAPSTGARPKTSTKSIRLICDGLATRLAGYPQRPISPGLHDATLCDLVPDMTSVANRALQAVSRRVA